MHVSIVQFGPDLMLSILAMDAVIIGLIVCCAVVYMMWLLLGTALSCEDAVLFYVLFA